jgi:hypothetical protein
LDILAFVNVAGRWRDCLLNVRYLCKFFIDYLEKGKTITEEYYSNLLTRVNEKIREKRPDMQKKKSSFIRTIHPPTKVFWQWEN